MSAPLDQAGLDTLFQQSVVDPSVREFQRDVIPSIQQAFGGQNAGSSSALNQALARSATDLQSILGQQRIGFRNQELGRQLQGVGLVGQLGSQKAFEPIVQQKQGILGPLIGAAGAIGGGLLAGPAGAAAGSSLGGGVR